MRICLMVEGQEGVSWEQWLALAGACEEAGLDGLFRSDHYLSIVRGGDAGSLDAWATLAALAARTERIRLGTMVSPVTFRHAAALAKNAVTVDHVSGGRVELGVGAGWYEAEHDAYGFRFPPLRERMDELDRQLDAIRAQLSDDSAAWPKPVQRRLPIVVGGGAKPRTVAAAVRHADEYNTTFADPETCRERRRVVDEAARAAGREPLRFSVMTGCVVGRDEAEVRERGARVRELTGHEPGPPMVVGTVEQAAERLREYEAAGVERIMAQHLVHEDVEMVHVLGELARSVA
jgi:alkanesulfonate monooxygenase SsuD/methylene tetrahydromethanopterin reductase-like flavin-dependent oxidoreductase (luciferase family)